MSVPSLEDLERQLSALPREAWDRPVPPPPPWPAEPERAPRQRRLVRLRRDGGGRIVPRSRRLPHAGGRPLGRRPRVRSARGGALVLRPLAAAALSVALLAAGLGAGLLVRGGDDGAPGEPGGGALRVQLQPIGDAGGRAGGVVTLEGGAGGSATVRLAGLAPSERDDFYELWLLGADGKLVSLGSVRVPASGRAELSVPLPVDPSRFTYLDVSREPADGDPAHSTDSVLRGPTT